MLPLILSPSAVRVGIAGKGDALEARLRMLERAGVMEPALIGDRIPAAEEMAALDIIFVAGLDATLSRAIYAAARAAGVLVNVEDVPKLCDFHVPAQLRRGDLLLTVSTAGRSPALSALVRETLEEIFSAEWEERLDEIARVRARLRSSGLPPSAVAARTREFLVASGWLGGKPE